MMLEMWGRASDGVAWLLALFAILALVLAPDVLVMTELRRRGLLDQAPVVRASAIGGLAGGALGLLLGPERYPTGGFFAVTVLVLAYYVFSRWLALLLRTESSRSVEKLLALQPATVRLVREGQEVDSPFAGVRVGDRVRVRPGERVPVDGRVVAGRSAVDQSLVTGESVPQQKREGDEVISGSVNGFGTLLVEVTRTGEDTFLQQVIRTIEDARELKPRVIDLVARVLRVYLPTVQFVAVGAGVFWIVVPAVMGDGPDLDRAVFASLSVLIMAYPCAMGLVAPLALVRGASEAAERGIILRTGEAFHFGQVDRVILDKTGTVTEGVFTVREVEPASEADLLVALAAAAEASSEHPVGAAIVAAARQRGLGLVAAEGFEAISGHGVRATVDGATVLVGRPSFVAARGSPPEEPAERVTALEEAGRTVVAISRDGAPLGVIALGDEIRAEARAVVDEMRRKGITPVLVTGDNTRAAQRVARALGIDDVRAEVLPEGKAEIVRALQREGHHVAMVGDGINDAPALTQADVGIAMGSGTDIAIESADVVIVGNRLEAVLAAREIGRSSYRRLRQNVVFAFLLNGIGVPLAATGLVFPIWAMAVMIASVTAVLANSMWGKWSRMRSTLRDVTSPFGIALEGKP
jgi:heavy metal translocating P-type ATPase